MLCRTLSFIACSISSDLCVFLFTVTLTWTSSWWGNMKFKFQSSKILKSWAGGRHVGTQISFNVKLGALSGRATVVSHVGPKPVWPVITIGRILLRAFGSHFRGLSGLTNIFVIFK